MDRSADAHVHRPLREAGQGMPANGSLLVWSVAQGARGRRWRAVATRDGLITQSLLLEIDTRGRPTRLELTTPAGLLTLHPEPDEGSIHGNVVAETGVLPLALPWSPDHELDVAGSPLAIGCGLHRLRSTIPLGHQRSVPVLAVDGSLAVTETAATVRRVAEDRWTVTVGPSSEERIVKIDADGLPLLGDRWPLEP
jgi:hypothetical protein